MEEEEELQEGERRVMKSVHALRLNLRESILGDKLEENYNMSKSLLTTRVGDDR